jgi:hypothetical protein
MLFSNLSSLDDSLGKATLGANGRPWWMDDPELIALRERTLEELKRASMSPILPVLTNPILLSPTSFPAQPAAR